MHDFWLNRTRERWGHKTIKLATFAQEAMIGGHTRQLSRGCQQDVICRACRKPGHHTRNCRAPQKRGGCFRCGSPQHHVRDCPLQPPMTKHERADNWGGPPPPNQGREGTQGYQPNLMRPPQQGQQYPPTLPLRNVGGKVYAMKKDEAEDAPDVVTGIFSIHSYPVTIYLILGLAILLLHLLLWTS